MTRRFIDDFAVLLFDMGNTFMFDADRFSDGEDFHRTYREAGGRRLGPEAVNGMVLRLFDHMLKLGRDPARYDSYPTVAECLDALPATAGLPAEEMALIEELGGTAHLHLCGTPGDFLKVISQGEAAAPYLIILAHGDERGLVFGEFADFIDTSMLVDGCMPPECIAEQVDLPGRVVLNDACGVGEVPMADAFMRGGLKGYVGSVEPIPHGTAGVMFIAHFFYKLWRTGCTEREAWEQAASYDADSRLYVYWDVEGCHRIGETQA